MAHGFRAVSDSVKLQPAMGTLERIGRLFRVLFLSMTLSLGLAVACTTATPADGSLQTTIRADGSGVRTQTITIPSSTLTNLSGGVPAVVIAMRQAAPSFLTISQTDGRSISASFSFSNPADLTTRSRQVTRSSAGPSLSTGGTPFARSFSLTEAPTLLDEFNWIRDALLNSTVLSAEAKTAVRNGSQRTVSNATATAQLPDGASQRVGDGQRVNGVATYVPDAIRIVTHYGLDSSSHTVAVEFGSGGLQRLVTDQGSSNVTSFVQSAVGGTTTISGDRLVVALASTLADEAPRSPLFKTISTSTVKDEHALGDVRVYQGQVGLTPVLGVLPKSLIYRIESDYPLEYDSSRRLHGEGLRRIVKTSGADNGQVTVSEKALEVTAAGTAAPTGFARFRIAPAPPIAEIPLAAWAGVPAAIFVLLLLLALAVRRVWTRATTNAARVTWGVVGGALWSLACVAYVSFMAIVLSPAIVGMQAFPDSDLGDALRAASDSAWRFAPAMSAALASGTPLRIVVDGFGEGAFMTWRAGSTGLLVLSGLLAAAVFTVIRPRHRTVIATEVVATIVGYAAVMTAAPAALGLLLPTPTYLVSGETVLSMTPRFEAEHGVGLLMSAALALAVVLCSTASISFSPLSPAALRMARTSVRAVVAGLAVSAALALVLTATRNSDLSLGMLAAAGPNVLLEQLGGAFQQPVLANIATPVIGLGEPFATILTLTAGLVATVLVLREARSSTPFTYLQALGAGSCGFATVAILQWVSASQLSIGGALGFLVGDVSFAAPRPELANAFAVALAMGFFLAARTWYAANSVARAGAIVPVAEYVTERPFAREFGSGSALPATLELKPREWPELRQATKLALQSVGSHLPESAQLALQNARPDSMPALARSIAIACVAALFAASLPLLSVSAIGARLSLSAHDLGELLSLTSTVAQFSTSAGIATGQTIPPEVRDLATTTAIYSLFARLMPVAVLLASALFFVAYIWRPSLMRLALRAVTASGIVLIIGATGLIGAYLVAIQPRLSQTNEQVGRAFGQLGQLGNAFGTPVRSQPNSTLLSVDLQLGVVALLLCGAALVYLGLIRGLAPLETPVDLRLNPQRLAVLGGASALLLVFQPWQKAGIDQSIATGLAGLAGGLGTKLPEFPDLSATLMGVQSGVLGLLVIALLTTGLWLHFYGQRIKALAGLEAFALPAVAIVVGALGVFAMPAELSRGIFGRAQIQQLASLGLGGANLTNTLNGLIKVELLPSYYLFLASCALMLAPLLSVVRARAAGLHIAVPATGAQQPVSTTPPATRTAALVGNSVGVWRCAGCNAVIRPGSDICATCGRTMR